MYSREERAKQSKARYVWEREQHVSFFEENLLPERRDTSGVWKPFGRKRSSLYQSKGLSKICKKTVEITNL